MQDSARARAHLGGEIHGPSRDYAVRYRVKIHGYCKMTHYVQMIGDPTFQQSFRLNSHTDRPRDSDSFLSKLEQALGNARSAANTAMVEAYGRIGQRIVGEEQQGQFKARAFTRPTCVISDSFFSPTRTRRFATQCEANRAGVITG